MTLHFFSKKIIFIAVFMSLAACLQVFADHFIYWRPALLQEFWRLWTAHWVHVGWVHYLLNILAFACLPLFFRGSKPGILSACYYYYLRLSVSVSMSCFHILKPMPACLGCCMEPIWRWQ